MFRRWKENGRKALLTMQAAVLSGMMTICSYAETVQDANWMKEDATSAFLLAQTHGHHLAWTALIRAAECIVRF